MSKEDVESKTVGTIEDDWEGQVAHDLQLINVGPCLEDLEFAFLVENEGLAWYEDRLLLAKGRLLVNVICMLFRRGT